jgi:hypothetical protein
MTTYATADAPSSAMKNCSSRAAGRGRGGVQSPLRDREFDQIAIALQVEARRRRASRVDRRDIGEIAIFARSHHDRGSAAAWVLDDEHQ